MMMPARQVRPALSKLRRRTFEALGSVKYSRPSLHDIDRKLERYLDFRDGVFVEAGANDGYNQSNTYYLEKGLGWSGVLVEAIPALYQRCRKERRNARVFNCALVADDYPEETVTMHYAGLMSLVEGARKSKAADQHHLRRWASMEPRPPSYTVEVPAKTLTQVLDAAALREIDLLSLDVEGYELRVLQGLDFDAYRPMYILIEANYRDEIVSFLDTHGYTVIDELSHHDLLFRRP